MGTALLIEKTIESYNCKHCIKLFIELAHFTHEIFVCFDLCNSDRDIVDFFLGACLCINMLSHDVDKKTELLQNYVRKNYKEFFSIHCYLLSLAQNLLFCRLRKKNGLHIG